jgi:hypothetical protein
MYGSVGDVTLLPQNFIIEFMRRHPLVVDLVK